MSSPKIGSLLQLILVCSALFAQGEARKVAARSVGATRSWTAEKVRNCYSSVEEIEKCVGKIMDDVVRSQYDDIGAECCKAVVGIDKECYTQFPFNYMKNPIWGPLLKQYCP